MLARQFTHVAADHTPSTQGDFLSAGRRGDDEEPGLLPGQPRAALRAGAVRPGRSGLLGSRAGGGPVSGALLALGTPLVAAVAWGIFVAPRARVSLPLAGRLAVELAVFGSATAALYATGHHTLASTLFIAATVNRALIHHWRQDERDRTGRAIP